MYGIYYGQPYGAPVLLSDVEPRPPAVKTNLYRDSYRVSGVFKRDRYTVLLFEDPFAFLDEESANLVIAEQYGDNNPYIGANRIAGVYRSGGYTLLMFEDPFLFLSESDESLIAAEQDNNINIYKNEDITTGVFST